MSSAASAATTAASAESPLARNVAAATDDCRCCRLRPVLVLVVVDVVASGTYSQLRRAGVAAADRRRPAATRQRRPHRGYGARRRRHADHRNIHSTDARVGRRTNRTHRIGCALISQSRATSLSPSPRTSSDIFREFYESQFCWY